MSTDFAYQWKAEVFERDASDRKVPLRWVCKNLQHNGFSFAKEIYINKVIVTLADETTRELVYADFEPFSMSSVIDGTTVKPEYDNLFAYGTSREGDKFNLFYDSDGSNDYYMKRHNFNGYGVRGSVMPFVCKKLSSTHPLFIFSAFSFGEYGKNPPHEFSGGLSAARVMPTIWFGTEDEQILSIRIDFCFHLHTDDNLPVPSGLLDPLVKSSPKPTTTNFASIIRDADGLPIFSCFNELFRVADLYLKTYFNYQKALAEYELLSLEVFTLGNILKIPDLIAKVGELVILATLLSTYMVAIIAELLVNIPKCIAHDIAQMIVDMMTVLKEEGELLQQKVLPVIAEAILIFQKMVEILDILGDDFADEVGTDLKVIIVPIISPWLLKKRRERRDKNLRRVATLMREEEILLAKIKIDFPIMVDQFIFVIGKIFNYVSFAACEKPVQYEMVGNFLLKGDVEGTWDNLHWWGTNFLPSAPGAFHAIHQHFRWSHFLGGPSPSEKLGTWLLFQTLAGGADPVSDPEKTAPFRTLVESFKNRTVGGPLIDPGLPNQTIQFGLAKFDSTLHTALRTIDADKSFVKIASGLSSSEVQQIAVPEVQTANEENFKGSDIVYWLSIKAEREAGAPIFRGSLLINGFYFAHDLEPDASLFGSKPTNFAAITKGTSMYRPPYVPPVKFFRTSK